MKVVILLVVIERIVRLSSFRKDCDSYSTGTFDRHFQIGKRMNPFVFSKTTLLGLMKSKPLIGPMGLFKTTNNKMLVGFVVSVVEVQFGYCFWFPQLTICHFFSEVLRIVIFEDIGLLFISVPINLRTCAAKVPWSTGAFLRRRFHKPEVEAAYASFFH